MVTIAIFSRLFLRGVSTSENVTAQWVGEYLQSEPILLRIVCCFFLKTDFL